MKTQPSFSAVGGVYSNQPTMIVVPLDAPTFPKLSRFDGLQPLGD